MIVCKKHRTKKKEVHREMDFLDIRESWEILIWR